MPQQTHVQGTGEREINIQPESTSIPVPLSAYGMHMSSMYAFLKSKAAIDVNVNGGVAVHV